MRKSLVSDDGEMKAKSRRRVMGELAALSIGGLATTFPGALANAQEISPTASTSAASEEVVGRVRAPTWTFIVYNYQDPYQGNVQNPTVVLPSTRVVGVEVEIANDSPNALPFYNGNIHLRASDGFDYFGSAVYGDEPRLTGRTLSRGDTARGWVWFGVPKDAKLDQIVLIAPAPELNVPVPN